jgi:hypothetical protein
MHGRTESESGLRGLSLFIRLFFLNLSLRFSFAFYLGFRFSFAVYSEERSSLFIRPEQKAKIKRK